MLVDAILGLVVLSGAILGYNMVLSDSVHRYRDTKMKVLAALEAETRLAEVGNLIAARPGVTFGSDCGMRWTVEVTRITPASSGYPTVLAVVYIEAYGKQILRSETRHIGDY